MVSLWLIVGMNFALKKSTPFICILVSFMSQKIPPERHPKNGNFAKEMNAKTNLYHDSLAMNL